MCKPILYQINAGSLINAGAWHNILMAPAMATKRKAYTVTTLEVAKKMSKEEAARQFDVMVICKWFAPKYK